MMRYLDMTTFDKAKILVAFIVCAFFTASWLSSRTFKFIKKFVRDGTEITIARSGSSIGEQVLMFIAAVMSAFYIYVNMFQ